MLQLAFPDAVDERTLPGLKALSPGYATNDKPERTENATDAAVLDELIQMNIGEIRTLIHQMLMRPVLVLHCVPENRSRLENLLDGLRQDEIKHVNYTGKLIDVAAAEPDSTVNAVMFRRLKDFNAITLDEVGAGSHD